MPPTGDQPHPWLAPPPSLVARIARARATAVLRSLPSLQSDRLGPRAPAWPPLLSALPALLRADAGRLLAVVGRIDVAGALGDSPEGHVDGARLERALVTLWLGLAGHPGLTSPLALPGPFAERVVDPTAARLLALGGVRGLVATVNGPTVIGRGGRQRIDDFVVGPLPSADGAVIVDERLDAPVPEIVERVRVALEAVRAALPAGYLERVTIGAGPASFGEARVGAQADAADLVASAKAAFVRAAAVVDPVLRRGGVLVESGRRVVAVDVLARTCGNAVALPWRAEAAASIASDVDDVERLAEPTDNGAGLLAALRRIAGNAFDPRHRALLVNVDTDDFVYSFQFARSVERRCVERGLILDRTAIEPAAAGDLAAELGGPVPLPLADGVEVLVRSEQDPALAAALARFANARYEVVVANVRPRLFHDLLASGLFAVPTLLWDRHLHGGLREEGERRGLGPERLRGLPITAWSLDRRTGEPLQPSLAAAGLEQGSGHVWPIDLEFFRSNAAQQGNRVFAGGENQRDWPLFVEAVRDLPLDVHLVTAHAPAALPANVRSEARLPLWRFRDAMASSTIAAIPLAAGAAAGVTVIPMAMALGVAVVATRTAWTEPLIRNGEDGLLVRPGDVRAFRDALVRLHEDPKLRARLAASARRRVAALCDLEAFTREMFATLD